MLDFRLGVVGRPGRHITVLRDHFDITRPGRRS